MSIYNTDPAVVQAGILRLWIVGSTYTLWGLSDVLMGGIRGYGISLSPMLINLVGTCGVRLIWIALLDTPNVSEGWVHFSFPMSWVCLLAVLAPYWIHLRRKEARMLASEGTTEIPDA